MILIKLQRNVIFQILLDDVFDHLIADFSRTKKGQALRIWFWLIVVQSRKK